MHYLQQVVICHAPEDAVCVAQLASFLKLNCPVIVSRDEGVVQPGDDLVDAAEQGLSADIVIVLLSPHSVPKPWRKEKWEPVFFGESQRFDTRLAFVLLCDCNFPPLFRRQIFFDLSQDARRGRRALKRWFLEQNPFFRHEVELPPRDGRYAGNVDLLETLASRLADSPGTEFDLSREIALTFAHAHRQDFEGVFWVDCANRSRTGILGDTAHRLGLKLTGTAEQNRAALQDFCADRRCLFIFEHLTPENRDLVSLTGKSSTIFTAPVAISSPCPFEETATLFSEWRQDPDACLAALGDAELHLRRMEDWRAAISLGFSMSDLLRHYGRLAEAFEILQFIENAAAGKDAAFMRRSEWEQCWIRNEWGQPSAPPDQSLRSQPVQLSLGLV